MNYRLGIDLGSTSLGWTVLDMDNNTPIDTGVRIFSDGREAKSETPLSVARIAIRGSRRLRDRLLERKKALMNCLVENNLMPKDLVARKDLQKKDPYHLRVKGLDKELSLHEFGRVLFHLNQRRGFKSNRKADSASSDTGTIRTGIDKLEETLKQNQCRTLGEYFYSINKDVDKHSHHLKSSIRIRPEKMGNKNEFTVFPDRSMYLNEFDKLWQEQSKHHKELTDTLKNKLKDFIIYYQRPLKSQEIGDCTFEDNEPRAPQAHPLAQQSRIYQEVNNLEPVNYTLDGLVLSDQNRSDIANMLLNDVDKFNNKKGELTFGKMRKEINIKRTEKFNLESEKRKGLTGDQTARILSQEDCFGKQWFSFDMPQRERIVEKLIDEQEENAIVEWLKKEFSTTHDKAVNISRKILPKGYGRLSLKAIRKILPFLKQGLKYPEACEKAGYHHSDYRPGETLKSLTYYGELMPRKVIGGNNKGAKPKQGDPIAKFEKYYGKINNPTVHIGLNQLMKVVNELIKAYGEPKEIIIELARDLKMGEEEKKKLNTQQAKNEKRNITINEELKKLGVAENYRNRLKYKLWVDSSKDIKLRCCPYTGDIIDQTDVFADDSPFEIDHILPFSKTYNDAYSNKVLSSRKANRYKKERTPFEAFGQSYDRYNWEEISERAKTLPDNKKWRFAPNAMEKVEGEDGIIARMLNDTRYMSTVAKEYLSFICNPNKVWSIPGQLTALLRDKWAVDLTALLGEDNIVKGDTPKNRRDHRHHAIDAFVATCTTRKILEQVSHASSHEYKHRLIKDMPPPLKNFDQDGRHKLKKLIKNMIISHKPNHKGAKQAVRKHSTIAPLHQDTYYGFWKEAEEKGKVYLTSRKQLTALVDKKPEKTRKNIEKIIDPLIRKKLLDLTENKSVGDIAEILKTYSENNNIYRVKTFDKVSRHTIRGIKDKDGEIYKYVKTGGNYCAEIYCPERRNCDGKCIGCKLQNKGVWKCEIISNFDVHKKDFTPKWKKDHPTAKLMMRLFINDIVAYKDGEKTKICRVKKMDQTGKVCLRDHRISQEDADKDSWTASSRQLHQKMARRLAVDCIGNVKDPYRVVKKCRL